MIEIEEKLYTTAEVIQIVHQVVGYVGQQSDHNSLTYSASDVYWVIRDLLKYANGRMEGEFILIAKKKGEWQIRYTDQKSGQNRAKKQRQRELNQTDKYLNQQKKLRKRRAAQSKPLPTLDQLFSQNSE